MLSTAAPRDRPMVAKQAGPGSSATDDFSDVLKLQRRSWRQSSNSSASSESCPSPRALEMAAAPRQAVVIEQQGMGKVVHRPDGTVVWEPSPEGSGQNNNHQPRSLRQTIIEGTLAAAGAVAMLGAMTGVLSAVSEITNAQMRRECLTTRQLTASVTNSVTAVVAGTLAGTVLGPVAAVRALGGVLLRPVLLGVAVHQAAKRVWRWRGGVERLLAKLQSAETSKVLEALRVLIAKAIKSNPRFCKEFCRLAGMEVLVKMLADALPDCPWLRMLAQAIAELSKDVNCREALVACGGVPRLVGLLRHSNPAVHSHALAALATLAEHPLAQDAIREAGGLARLVEMTAAAAAAANHANVAAAAAPAAAGAAPAPAAPIATMGYKAATGTMLPAIKLLQALALDPANKAAIGAAGGVAALLDVVRAAEAKGELQAQAVAALHNLLRGSPDNQRALVALPNASEVLRAALASCGPCWHPVKSDLHALLNVLARHAGAQESSGFVVVQGAVAGMAPAN